MHPPSTSPCPASYHYKEEAALAGHPVGYSGTLYDEMLQEEGREAHIHIII